MIRPLLIGMMMAAAAVCLAAGCGRSPSRPVAVPSAKPAPAASPAAATTQPSDHPLADLKRRLATSENSRDRVLTIDAIATHGAAAKDALDDLLKATTDPEPRVRWHAARAIGLIGEDALSAVPSLVDMLRDDDAITAAQAAAAIRRIRADDERTAMPPDQAAVYETAVEPLVTATVHPDPRVRRAAVHAIRQLDADTNHLATLLSAVLADSQPDVILPALHTLADMDGEAVPVLVEALKNPKARYWAAVGLTEIGPEAAPAVSSLETLAARGEPEERMQALLALAAIGPDAASAAPVVIEALKSDDGAVRFAAAFALGKLRAKAADAPLADAIAGADPFLAEVAAWARARINPDDASLLAEALKRLREGLANEQPKIRAASISGLSDLAAQMEPAERQALAADLVKMLGDPATDVGMRSGAALIRMGAEAVTALRPELANAEARLAILEIIAAIGPPAQGAIDEIQPLLLTPDPAVRGEAAVALAAIGPSAAPAVPSLQALLANSGEEPGARYAAAYALGRIGTAAKPAFDLLRGLAESEDELLATVAVWAALKIEPGNPDLFAAAMPRLRAALRSEKDLARLEAAVALGDMGSAAKTAIPMLEVVEEDDPVRAVRSAAAEALRKIIGG